MYVVVPEGLVQRSEDNVECVANAAENGFNERGNN
jgi:hypothetical protein